jgi:hypothetical protein
MYVMPCESLTAPIGDPMLAPSAGTLFGLPPATVVIVFCANTGSGSSAADAISAFKLSWSFILVFLSEFCVSL